MIYAKITELKDRYMIYNSVKNERKWRDKEMDCDNQELEATKDIKFYKDGEMTIEYAIQRLTNLAQERNENWLGLTNIEAMQAVLKEIERLRVENEEMKEFVEY